MNDSEAAGFMDALRAAGLRATRSRMAVLDALGRSPHAVSAQQLFTRLHGRRRAPGLATIYRTLSALAEAGRLDTFRRGDEQVFRLCGEEHHHHLVCDSCGRVEEVESDEVEAWVRRVTRGRSFAVRGHRADIFGECRRCRSRRAPSRRARSVPSAARWPGR